MKMEEDVDAMVRAALGEKFADITRIGKGGMGSVYHAVLRATREPRAIKVAKDNAFLPRFQEECRVSGKLGNHPRIVRVLDAGELNGVAYMAMDFVPGHPLTKEIDPTGGREKRLSEQAGVRRITPPPEEPWEAAHTRLQRKSAMSPRRALTVAKQVCEGLEHVHAQGVRHRDIKPSNILIDEKGQVKLTDFGISKSLSAAGEEEGWSTLTGHRAMSPPYASPEQKNGGTADHCGDIFSLGVTTHEMLTGQLPPGTAEHFAWRWKSWFCPFWWGVYRDSYNSAPATVIIPHEVGSLVEEARPREEAG